MIDVIIREDREKYETQIHRKEDTVQNEADMGVMLPQQKECLKLPPEVARGKDSPLVLSEGV